MIYYSEELLKTFLKLSKFYSNQYSDLNDLDNNYNFRRYMLHDIIPLINKQKVINVSDYEILYENKLKFGICEHYFRRAIFELLELFKPKINIIESQSNFVEFFNKSNNYKCV